MNQDIIRLFDRFTHGGMGRRRFLDRLALLAGGVPAALALLPALENNYALADMVAPDDERLATESTEIIAAGVILTGYVARPKGAGKLPGLLVVHENRGLNPHIRDVTRRFALEGYTALGLDFLSPSGGTPDNEDAARDAIGKLDPAAIIDWAKAAVADLRAREDGTGKVGAVGFCWGGGVVNNLAVADGTLDAGIAYYGKQPDAGKVAAIHAPLLLHYAGLDDRINGGIADFEAALKSAGRTYELYMYENVNHAFNNDTNQARYDKAAADLAWSRSVAFLKKYLG